MHVSLQNPLGVFSICNFNLRNLKGNGNAPNVSISPSCITGLPTQNLHGPKGTKVALCSGPTLGHHGTNVDSPLEWASHREPAVSPKLWSSPE